MEHPDVLPQWAEKWVSWIRRTGLPEVVRLGLESVRPVGFLGAQVVLLLRPIVGGLFEPDLLEYLAALLENPQLQEQFLALLEQEGAS